MHTYTPHTRSEQRTRQQHSEQHSRTAHLDEELEFAGLLRDGRVRAHDLLAVGAGHARQHERGHGQVGGVRLETVHLAVVVVLLGLQDLDRLELLRVQLAVGNRGRGRGSSAASQRSRQLPTARQEEVTPNKGGLRGHEEAGTGRGGEHQSSATSDKHVLCAGVSNAARVRTTDRCEFV